MKYGLSEETYNKIKEVIKKIKTINLFYLVLEQEVTIKAHQI